MSKILYDFRPSELPGKKLLLDPKMVEIEYYGLLAIDCAQCGLFWYLAVCLVFEEEEKEGIMYGN